MSLKEKCENINKLVKWEKLIKFVRIVGAELLRVFAAFCVFWVQGKTASCCFMGEVIRKVEMATNWGRLLKAYVG